MKDNESAGSNAVHKIRYAPDFRPQALSAVLVVALFALFILLPSVPGPPWG